MLNRTTNPRLLAAIRVAIGICAIVKGAQLLLLGYDWIPIAAWLVLALAFTAGWWPRWTAFVMVALGTYLLVGVRYNNHFYLMLLMLLLIAVSDSGRCYALRPSQCGAGHAWPITLMRALVSIVYVYAGVAKINGEFLSGDALASWVEQSMLPLEAPAAGAIFVVLALATITTEVFVGVAVWSRRLRPVAFALVLPLHLGMLIVATSWFQLVGIGIFAVLMFILLTAFLDLPERGRLVVWDDSCSFCRRWVAWFRRLDAFGAFRFVGASSAEAYAGTGVTPAAAAEAMQLVEPDGRVLSGYDAVRGIIAVLPGGFLLAPWMAFPGVPRVGRARYRRVAARRTCSYVPSSVPRAPHHARE
jgi:predicted DCC family thiol-disulfide oxidoreductase YuxK